MQHDACLQVWTGLPKVNNVNVKMKDVKLKMHLSDLAQRQKAFCGIYFKKK